MRRRSATAGATTSGAAAARLRAAVVGVALVCAAGRAEAHPQFTSTGSNRYVKVTLLGGGSVRIAYTVMVGEVPAAAARRAADTNGDGRVDEAEQAAAARAFAAAVDAGLAVEVDGRRVHPAWEPPVAGFSTDVRVGPLPYSIDLVGRLLPGTGAHLLRVDDATPLADLAETEIRLEEGPGTRLVAGWQGREDAGRVARFTFEGPKFSALEDRSVGFRYVDESAPSRAGAHDSAGASVTVAIAAAAIAAAIAVVVAVVLRRRRRAT